MRLETLIPGTEPNVAMGAPVTGAAGIQRIAQAARDIEDWGFDGATTPETGHDPFLPIVIAAEHTSRISLGTNVAIAFPRSPMVTAQLAWDLQKWSGGRFRLGIGTQVKGHNERRYSTPWPSPPGPRLREYVLCLKAIFQTFQDPQHPTFFHGEHYQFSLISPFFSPGRIDSPGVPIYISALNPYMARLAGELCEGIRLHPLMTTAYGRDVVLPQIEAGAQKAGRSRSDIDVVSMPFIISGGTQAEVEATKAATRLHIAFYASTRTYHAVLRHHGWEDAAIKLHQLSIEGRRPEMGPLITDEMLDHFAVMGTYDEIMPQLQERWGSLCSTVFMPLPNLSGDAQAQAVRALLNR